MSIVGKVGKVGIVGKMGKVCTRQPRRFRATASYGHPVASAGQPPRRYRDLAPSWWLRSSLF